MKKICFVTTVSLTIKSFLIEYANYLIYEDNYDVTFICNEDDKLYEFCNEHIHYIPIRIDRGISFDGLAVIKQLKKIFKTENFDIIQYSTPNAAFYASIAARLSGCSNRLYCQWGIRYMGFESGLKRIIFKCIEKATCCNSTFIECESHSIRNFSISEGLFPKEKSCVTWYGSACGVNLKKYDITNRNLWRNEIRRELGLPESAVVFGYCGRLTKDKGINELLEAFKDIENPNAYLLLIGSFDINNSLKAELVEWAKNCKNIVFVDWTNQLEKYYSAMDVFASLSYREGFGLVVIEAAAMCLPAIVSNVPGQLDTIVDGEDGWLVNIDIDEISSSLKWCADNYLDLEKYGYVARKKVEDKYEQTKLFKQMTLLRNELIAK